MSLKFAQKMKVSLRHMQLNQVLPDCAMQCIAMLELRVELGLVLRLRTRLGTREARGYSINKLITLRKHYFNF